MKRFANLAGLMLAWLAVFGLFSFLVPQSFPTLANLETLMRQVVIDGFAAAGMTYIIVSGGIDLSIGSVVALVTVVVALCLKAGLGVLVAAIAGIATGTLCGLANGLLVSSLGVGPFIVTLGGLLAYRGVAKWLASEQKVDAPLSSLNQLTAALRPEERWHLLPSGAWAMLGFAGLAALALRYTVFGRHVVAIGSNEAAARLCGVRVFSVKTGVYAVGGLAAGLAGVLQFSRLSVGDPTVASGLELSVIAAVVIGGGSLSGGEGSVAGAIVGALIMNTIRSGCSQAGYPQWTQEIITGVIILVAVALDRWRIARAQRG